MVTINSVLDPYSKIEKDKEVISVIHSFLALFKKMQINDRRTRRQLYIEIYESLKKLGSIDYEVVFHY